MAGPAYPGLVAGVELGGTKCICTLGIAPDLIVAQQAFPTSTPDETLGAIADQLARWHAEHGFHAIGIGSFGPLDLDPASPAFGHIQRTAKPGWSGADVLGAVAGRFDLPCRLDTDVNAAAIAELRWGAGRGAEQLAYVTIGTGIGVGFAGRDQAGASTAHAELGHARAARRADDMRASVCPFHSDCIEGLASGRAIMAAMAGAVPSSVAFEDPRWANPIDALGQLCHMILCARGSCRIVFGGGVTIGNPGLVAHIEKSARQSLNGYLTLPDQKLMTRALLGGQAGPLGSLGLALDALASGSHEAVLSQR